MHIYCLRYCFMGILQKELNSVDSSWNEHLIRGSNMSECPNGIPDELFFLPENSGTSLLHSFLRFVIVFAQLFVPRLNIFILLFVTSMV